MASLVSTVEEEGEGSDRQDGTTHRRPRFLWTLTFVLGTAGALAAPSVWQWQRAGDERATSLSNIRRVGLGALLYAQDYDSSTMPPPWQLPDRTWVTWPNLLRPYVTPDSSFSNPSNPVLPFHSSLRDPVRDIAVNSSYAVNKRLWNTFGPGPFPLDNLELPEQTVLFTEAGRMWRKALHSTPETNIGALEYGDTTDRYSGLFAYPSTHGGRMAVVAADGHGILITVQHYSSRDGIHDTLYGRLAPGIYNWNGGHPNGETDKPARE